MAHPVRAHGGATAAEKERQLVAWLRSAGSVAIGYSGGVDSAYLASVALEALGRDRVLAIIGRSATYPESQWQTARDLAAGMGLPVLEVNTDEINDPNYAANPTNRCYFCKTELWSVLAPAARLHGLAAVLDGTNADDTHDYRPGAAAAREHGVRSPLAEVGLTKAEIRERSRERGLPSWEQPSSPCLASRIPYGTAVTVERLQRIGDAEAALRAIGVRGDLRVRHHDDLARVEMSIDEVGRWLEPDAARRLRAAVLRAGYARVAIDLRGFRSGSLNVLGGVRSE